MQNDPIQDGINWLNYSAANPAIFVDPSGKNAASACAGTGLLLMAIDGPLPIGDIIGAPLVVVGGVIAIGVGIGEIVKSIPRPRDRIRDRKRKKCNDKAAECIERTEGLKISPDLKRLLMAECYWCQMQCINNGLSWPNKARCNYKEWPDGHRWK